LLPFVQGQAFPVFSGLAARRLGQRARPARGFDGGGNWPFSA
jgi:hypothetical protein